MFRQNKKEKSIDKSHPSANIVGSNSTIRGEFFSRGSVRIEGSLEGNATTCSKLVMSESALVKGDVLAHDAEISGRVEGEVRVKGTLFLHEKAVVSGNIFTKKLVIELGATFNGSCKMGDFVSKIDIKDEKPGGQPAVKAREGVLSQGGGSLV